MGNGSNMLELGGVPADQLADTYGTPLGVIDLGAVDAAIRTMTAACTPHGVAISYAGKAFLAVEFVRFLAGYDIGLDVCSLGELAVAERAGFPRERITLHGAGKTTEECKPRSTAVSAASLSTASMNCAVCARCRRLSRSMHFCG